MESKPTHEQAQLHLQTYDLRREPRLREAREWFFKHYHVQTLDDAMRLAAPGTDGGTFTMMVCSYWEQACALLNYGLLHDDLFFETSGEFYGVWTRLQPVIGVMRTQFKNPKFLENLEHTANRFEIWSERRAPGHLAAMRDMMQKTSGPRNEKAKAA